MVDVTFGSGGRWQTCIQLAASGQTLLVDCGATSLVALKAQRIDPNTIDSVVVTHLHDDHFGGLPFLILAGQFSGPSTPLVLAGPPGTAERLATVRGWQVEHACGAPPLAVNIALDGSVFAYSGDTQWTPADFDADWIVLTHMSTSMLGRLTEVDQPAAYNGMTVKI